jgi:hypothetical protein
MHSAAVYIYFHAVFVALYGAHTSIATPMDRDYSDWDLPHALKRVNTSHSGVPQGGPSGSNSYRTTNASARGDFYNEAATSRADYHLYNRNPPSYMGSSNVQPQSFGQDWTHQYPPPSYPSQMNAPLAQYPPFLSQNAPFNFDNLGNPYPQQFSSQHFDTNPYNASETSYLEGAFQNRSADIDGTLSAVTAHAVHPRLVPTVPQPEPTTIDEESWRGYLTDYPSMDTSAQVSSSDGAESSGQATSYIRRYRQGGSDPIPTTKEYTYPIDRSKVIGDNLNPDEFEYDKIPADYKVILYDRVSQTRPYHSDTLHTRIRNHMTLDVALRLLGRDTAKVDAAAYALYPDTFSKYGDNISPITWMTGLENKDRRETIRRLAEVTQENSDRIRAHMLKHRIHSDVARAILAAQMAQNVESIAIDKNLIPPPEEITGKNIKNWRIGLSRLQRTTLTYRMMTEFTHVRIEERKQCHALLAKSKVPKGYGLDLLRVDKHRFPYFIRALISKSDVLRFDPTA